MKGSKAASLTLELKGRVFAPGDAVRGFVRLVLPADREGRSLSVTLSARRRAVRPGRGVAISYERNVVWHTTHELDGERVYRDGAVYPFELLVPDTALELEFGGAKSKAPFPLEWNVAVALATPFRTTLKDALSVQVNERTAPVKRPRKKRSELR